MKLQALSIRRAWVGFGLMSACALAIASWGWEKCNRAMTQLDQTRQAAVRSADHLQQLRALQPAMAEATELLAEWQSTARIKPLEEQRWTQLMASYGQTFGITRFDYELDPPVSLRMPGAQVGWQLHPLTIHAQGLHEGLLLDLLKRMTQQEAHLVLVDRCTLTRTHTPPSTVRVDASCGLSWVSLAQASGEKR